MKSDSQKKQNKKSVVKILGETVKDIWDVIGESVIVGVAVIIVLCVFAFSPAVIVKVFGYEEIDVYMVYTIEIIIFLAIIAVCIFLVPLYKANRKSDDDKIEAERLEDGDV